LTGLSGSGKTTIAKIIKNRLKDRNHAVIILDCDEIRKFIYPELGFSKKNREINVKTVAYIAKLLCENDLIVIASLISPFREHRFIFVRMIL